MKHSCPVELLFLLLLWLTLMLARAGVPVSEDGAQLAYIHDLHELTVKIRGDQELSQQHLAKIRAMEEGSKAVALAMAQMDSLVKHGQLLTQSPDGQAQTAAANGLQYDGNNFSGGNYQFIDNLMGQNGPIALDRMLPSTLIPVSGGLLQQAQNEAAHFATSASSNILDATMGSLLGNLASFAGTKSSTSATQLFSQLWQGQGVGQAAMMADGVFLRPYAGKVDDAFHALVEQGTPLQAMQFFADPSLGGNGYNTIMGSNNPGVAMIDLDNVFSTGASFAYQNYLQGKGSTEANPYQGYASQFLPQLASMLQSVAPGEPLVPTNQEVSTAQQSPNLAGESSSYPSLFGSSALPPNLGNEGAPFGPTGLADPTTGDRGVVVVQPKATDAQAYQRKIAESDERLKAVTQEINTQQQAKDYLQKILQSLAQVEQQAESLQKELNTVAPNSLPELTLMIRDVQGDIEARQQEVSSLSGRLENLQQELHRALADRAQTVAEEKQEESVHALPRWRSGMAGN